MAEEFWKTSPFGENSIFAPGWDDKQKSVRKLKDQENLQDIPSSAVKDGVEINLINGQIVSQAADGYYYNQDGTFYGKHGTSDLISICSKVEKINEKSRYHITYKTNIKYADLILVAGTAIGESSYGYGIENRQEVYALANAILNYYYYINRSNGSIRSSIIKMKAFAAINENAVYTKFIDFTDEKRNYNFCKEAIGAALNALHEQSCIDYSNGATHWDGIDIKQTGRKWEEGLKFEDASADIFSIGDNKNTVKQKYADGKYYERIYDYKWIGTKGLFGINEKKKNIYHPYFEGDTINKNKFGTVLMRLSNDYNNRLKYGDKKVD
jgi:hypothetical protein